MWDIDLTILQQLCLSSQLPNAAVPRPTSAIHPVLDVLHISTQGTSKQWGFQKRLKKQTWGMELPHVAA